MSNIDDYNAKLETIMAIPDEKATDPNLPVSIALQESENLSHWALDDLAKLKTVGLTKAILQDLPVRTGACREAESMWKKDFRSQLDAQKQWSILSPLAYDLRNSLLHTMYYAYRNDENLLGRVRAIAEGDGHADMIQDLNDITVLGQENPEPLSKAGLDLAQLETAGTMSDEMGSLLAAANGDKAEQTESKTTRDKAYYYMKELVDEIRAAGKFLFWKDKNRLKGYSSQYWKKQNTKRDKNATEETD